MSKDSRDYSVREEYDFYNCIFPFEFLSFNGFRERDFSIAQFPIFMVNPDNGEVFYCSNFRRGYYKPRKPSMTNGANFSEERKRTLLDLLEKWNSQKREQ